MKSITKDKSKASSKLEWCYILLIILGVIVCAYNYHIKNIKEFNKAWEFTKEESQSAQYPEHYFITVDEATTKNANNFSRRYSAKGLHNGLVMELEEQGIKINSDNYYKYKNVFKVTISYSQWIELNKALIDSHLLDMKYTVNTSKWFNEKHDKDTTVNINFGVNYERKMWNPVVAINSAVHSMILTFALIIIIVLGLIFVFFGLL